LVLRALGLGDLLTAVPALRALRRSCPEDRVLLAAPGQLAELVELIDAVDELVPTEGLGELRAPGPPRLAVNLHGRGPQSIRDLLAEHPGELLTHRHPSYPKLPGPAWRADLHEVERWCRLVEYVGIPADRADLSISLPAEPSPVPGAIVLHPGAAYPARRWPAQRYARVAEALTGQGHPVVVTGTGAERELAEYVAAQGGLPAESVLAGRTGLGRLASVVAEARLVICGDTGVGHLATAYGTPSVLLFGPTPPRLWGPPVEREWHRTLWAGEGGDPHGDQPSAGLLRLSVTEVLAEISTVLAAAPGSDRLRW
jgi:ADP-heptose:LPS heptosyltransferase